MSVLTEIINDGTVTVLGGGFVALGGTIGISEISRIFAGQSQDVLPVVFSAVAVGFGLYGLAAGGIRLLDDLGDLMSR